MSGWHTIITAAEHVSQTFTAALKEPQTTQHDFLKTLIAKNARTHFGRRHDFHQLQSWEDYASAVSIRTYTEFAPWIECIAAGEAGVLTADPVIACEETGGSEAGSKLIPLTAGNFAAFRAAVLPWLHDLATRRPAITKGKSYVAISPATRKQRCTSGGIPVGAASDAAYLGEDLAPAFFSLLAVSPQVALIESVEEWQIETLAQLVDTSDLAFVSVWSPTFFLELIEALPMHADAVSARICSQGRQRLKAALHGGKLDTTKLWPHLDIISCWTSGASAPYAERLGEVCPQAEIEAKGLFATEAAITVPWSAAQGCVPALTSTFLEFVNEDGAVRLAHELQSGKRYRVLVTTPGGLYRYDMGDVVRCVAMHRYLPVLAFEGRASLSSDLVGEKLDDAFVAQVLAKLAVPAALHPCHTPKPYYQLWVGHVDNSVCVEDLVRQVEEGLACNPQYAYARRMGQLAPITVVIKENFQAEHNLALARAGRRLGDTKPSALVK